MGKTTMKTAYLRYQYQPPLVRRYHDRQLKRESELSKEQKIKNISSKNDTSSSFFFPHLAQLFKKKYEIGGGGGETSRNVILESCRGLPRNGPRVRYEEGITIRRTLKTTLEDGFPLLWDFFIKHQRDDGSRK